MRRAVLAAEHAAGAVPRPIARGIAERRLFGFEDEIERHPEAAAKLAVAAGIGQEFVVAEMQREARFRHFEAAEFQAADRMPLPDRRPAVAARRRAAAGTRMKQVPDEAAAGARILALHRDAETGGPIRP